MGAEQNWLRRLSVPAYRIGEAASYARVSPQTVAQWEKVKDNGTAAVAGRIKGKGLSYLQLIEIAVVAAMRNSGVQLRDIRDARKFLSDRWGQDFPFARTKFKTDGVDIFLEFRGFDHKLLSDRLLSANKNGQLVWVEMLNKRFLEFDYDSSGLVKSWLVFGVDKSIVIDPRIAFGAPNVRGIPTRVLKDRWVSGEEIEDLAVDFDISAELVREGLDFEGIDGQKRIVN